MVQATAADKLKQEDEREAVRKLMDAADDLLEAVDASDFCKHNATARHYPLFDASEIELGPVLGHGGFGVVCEVEIMRLKESKDPVENAEEDQRGNGEEATAFIEEGDADDDDTTEHDHYDVSTARIFMAQNVRRNGVDARYAVKLLRPDLSELDRTRGMIDVAIEIKFLSRLWHPNIVKMRGYCTGPILHRDFFFIMDRLYETLDRRIRYWHTELHQNVSTGFVKVIFGRCGCSPKEKEGIERECMVQRLTVAYDLASAFSYMHQSMLVYRDIKQENIGFDVRGDVKVFDFGLCKGLSPSLRATDKSGVPMYGYNLTPRTGSIPYMAPEVAFKEPYDSKCDVFSFAILVWEILSLKDAYSGYSIGDYVNRVARHKERMQIPRKIKPLLKLMIKEAWDHEPQKRPDMKRVATIIRGVMNDMCDGDDSVLRRTEHMINRSRHSMRAQQRGEGKSIHGTRSTWVP